VNAFVGGFLAYETRAAGVLAAADADPASALLNAYAGMLWLLLESPQGPRPSRPLCRQGPRRARRRPSARTGRGRFPARLVRRRHPHAWTIADTILAAWPRDLLILKLRQYHDFNRGDFPAMLRAAASVATANADVPTCTA
jgi:hypothetical protein